MALPLLSGSTGAASLTGGHKWNPVISKSEFGVILSFKRGDLNSQTKLPLQRLIIIIIQKSIKCQIKQIFDNFKKQSGINTVTGDRCSNTIYNLCRQYNIYLSNQGESNINLLKICDDSMFKNVKYKYNVNYTRDVL